MRASVFNEPEVEVAGGAHHVDPRYGVADYGPVDYGTPGAKTEIRVGLVGPAEGVEGTRRWLERCRGMIPAKPNQKHPRLFRDFPGFDSDSTFRSRLVFDDSLTRTVPSRALAKATARRGALGTVNAVELYAAEAADLASTNRCDVIICARPDNLEDGNLTSANEEEALDAPSIEVDKRVVDFRDLLKARLLTIGPPLQLVRSSTWDPSRARAHRSGHRRYEPR